MVLKRTWSVASLVLLPLLAGCTGEVAWEDVAPDDLAVTLNPDPPVPGEAVTVTTTAPTTGRIAVAAMAFGRAGSEGTERIDDRVSVSLGPLEEDDLVVYWGGAYQRDHAGTMTLELTPIGHRWVGSDVAPSLEVRLSATQRTDATQGLDLVANVIGGSDDISVSAMTRAFRGQSDTYSSEPRPFDREEDGTYTYRWNAGAFTDDTGPWTVTVAVLARDATTGAVGAAIDRFTVA